MRQEEKLSLDWQIQLQQSDESRQNISASVLVEKPFIELTAFPSAATFNQEVDTFINGVILETFGNVTEPAESFGDFGWYVSFQYLIPTATTWDLSTNPAYFFESTPTISAEEGVMETGHQILAVLFITERYLGGAHPGAIHDAINFDLTTGNRLQLSDLFLLEAPYLDLITHYSIAELAKVKDNLDSEYAEAATIALENDYTEWVITRQGLLIVFGEYQVGPYAAGPQVVLIPYNILTGMLNPYGPLGDFAK